MPNLIYATGTVAIGAAGVSVAGAGGPLWASNVQQFDKLIVDGFAGVDILGVTDDTHLVIAKWPFAAVPAGTAYQILQTSPLRFNGAQNSAEVIRLTGALETDGFYIFVRADQAGPDPSKGDEGQYARQPATGKEWYKIGGVWTFIGVSKPLGNPAPYDNARVYSFMDVATANGTSYVWINQTPGSGHAPPDATYWVVLASKGDTGATGPVPWLQTVSWATGQNYVAAAPASIVVHPLNKNIYQCIVPHMSGNFAADLAAGKWLLIGQSAVEGTSTSSIAIGTGAKPFTTQVGLSYQSGVRLRASSNGSPTNWVEGVCTYDPTTGALSMAADKANGAGTFTDWNFNRVGQAGAGDVSSANAGSEYIAVASTFRKNIGAPTATKAAAYTALLSDIAGTLLLSGAFTLSFDAAATLTNKWSCTLKNIGSGIVTLDPNSTELIDGQATVPLLPGQSCDVVCDGAALYTMRLSNEVVTQLTASAQPYLVIPLPAGYSSHDVTVDELTHTADGNLLLTASSDGGVTYAGASSYKWNYIYSILATGTSAVTVSASDSDSSILLAGTSQAAATSHPFQGRFSIYDALSSVSAKSIASEMQFTATTGPARRRISTAGEILVSNPLTHVRLAMSVGNISAAKATLRSKV